MISFRLTDEFTYRKTTKTSDKESDHSGEDGHIILTVRRVFEARGEKPKVLVDIESQTLLALLLEMNPESKKMQIDLCSEPPTVDPYIRYHIDPLF